MDKWKRFVFEHKRQLALFGITVGVTILLCVPFTMGYAVKVFGWAVWFYLAAAYVAQILNWTKKTVNLTSGSAAFLIMAVFFSIAALHVAFIPKESTTTFADYIIGSYERKTVGGAVFGIVTSPFTVWFTYVWALVIFLVFSALFFFLFLRPFIFEGTRSPIIEGKKVKKPVARPVSHVIDLSDAPFLKKDRAPMPSPKPVPILVNEEELREEKKELSPRDLLFGGKKEEFVGFDRPGGAYDETGGRRMTPEEDATEMLFGKEEKKETPVIDVGDEEKKIIDFEKEKDKDLIDLLQPTPEMEKFRKALTAQATERNAPPLISPDEETTVGNEEETAATEDGAPVEEPVRNVASPVQNSARTGAADTAQETPVQRGTPATGEIPISTQYVFYNNTLIPVVYGTAGGTVPQTAPVSVVPRAGATQNVVPQGRSPQIELSRSPFPTQAQPQGYGAKHFVPSTQEEESVQAEPAVDYFKSSRLVICAEGPYSNPPLTLFENYVRADNSDQPENLPEIIDIFENRLQNFGVEARFIKAIKGPTVTLCLIELGEKCPFSRLGTARVDLQRWLRSPKPITILPQVENTGYCGVEIPNQVKEVVGFKEILSSKEYLEKKGDLVVALGKTARGDILVDDLAAMPHALIAGETGSGKSVCLNVIISSLIYRYSPEEVKLILIDLKQVEMAPYAGLPHMLLKEPLIEIDQIVNVLKWVREEVVQRFALFKTLHIRNLNEYNSREGVIKLPRIVLIIDEASELMSDPNARKTLEATLNSLARIARAAGVHLLFATQNPVKTVITSEIQNNLPVKIAFAVSDYVHSQVIFKQKGAELLLGRGDMYIKKTQELVRAQCAYISTAEIENMVGYVKEFNEYTFDDEAIKEILEGKAFQQAEESKKQQPASAPSRASGGVARTVLQTRQPENDDEDGGEADDDLMWNALKVIVDTQYVTCSFLQRKLRKGYNTIANVLEQLADQGYISSVPQGSKEKREILISKDEFYKLWKERYGEDEDYALENFDAVIDAEEASDGTEPPVQADDDGTDDDYDDYADLMGDVVDGDDSYTDDDDI